MKNKPMDMAICRTQPLVTILTALFFLFSFGLASAQTSIDTSFLDSNANADGSISLTGDVSQPYQSTAESIITYEALGQSDATAAVNGRAYLDSITVNSTENLALRLLTSPLNAPNFNAALAEINQRQNRDGGVGAFVDFSSDLISTSFVLRALSRARVVNEVSGRAVSYLLAQQNTDGSWSLQGNPNRVETTALVVNGLWLYRQSYQLSDALSNGVTYLASQRGTDNLWEEVEGSALALSAVLNVEVDRSAYQTSMANFANLQNSNGSFSDDVYLTALGLRVLDAIQRPAPDEIVLSGQAVDGDTGLPLANVQVELAGPETLRQATDSNGMFSWQDIQPGNYRLSLSLNGFSTLTANTLLQTGDKRDFGVLTLLRAATSPTTGTIIGTVTDASDGSALAGVMITATGVSQAAMTNADGQFQLNDISPGAVNIQAALPSYATAIANANILAGQTLIFSPNLTPLAEAQVVVEGVVMDRDTSQGLEGVVVRVQGGGNDTEAVTDDSGRYEIAGLQAGSLTLSASLAGYQAVSGNVAAPTNARINFSPSLVIEGAPPEPVANSGIIGRVIDRISGLPLSGADISLVLNSDTQSIVSGADGEFALSNLNAGTAQLSISFTGYQAVTTTIELTENIILNIGDVTLLADGIQETAAVRGMVVDSRTNEPLTGVVVNGQFASGNVSLVTDASGAFEFLDLLDTEGELIFTLDTYNTTNFGLQLSLNETLDIGQIRLRPEDIEELIPDLAVQSLSAAAVSTDLQTLAISGSISVSVRNQGNAEVNFPTTALAFYDVDSSNAFDAGIDQILGQVALPDTVAVDEDVSLTIPVSGSLPFRDAPIYVWADSEQALIEIDEDNNITSTADQCEPAQCNLGTADSRDFEPVVKWAWTGSTTEPLFDQVMMTPLVAQANDDNNDGVINQNDIPDVIFSTFSRGTATGSSGRGLVRIVSGADGSDLAAFSSVINIEAYGNLAVGDIDNDAEIEILAPGLSGLYAFERDGTQKWYQPDVGAVGWGGATLADLNADGITEIIVAGAVLDNNGNILWNNPVVGGQFIGGVPVAADIDLDGQQEVIFGGTVFDADGNMIWQNSTTPDGLSGIGNFDQDERPEIAVVRDGTVSLLDDNGDLLWRVNIPGGGLGGSPTVADMDGDGEVEVGVAGQTRYAVFNADGSVLWQVPVVDASSQMTGSSVFDFDNDGDAEVVYADETMLHVFDGATGEVVFETPHSSGTTYENPVIVDIDNDGHAEIVVAQNNYAFGSFTGVRVFEDVNDAWVDTRSIWNQHAYNIDNINSNGSIPSNPARSWLTHNTFRLNTFPECRLESSDLAPVVKWRWQGASVEPSADSVYGPVTVGQLTDDNNDGLIDINDTPDVIFGSFGGTVGVLNAVNGEDGSEIWSTRDFDITRFGSTAIGDIDGDSIVEIVVVNDNRSELFAFEHDGSLKWRVSSGPTRSDPPRDAIAIADLDGDGSPEIIHGRRVHNADGTLRWEGTGGFGDNSNYGYLPTVADIDLDGTPEVIAGRTVYSASGDIVWNRTDIGGDGFTGIGNFDEDDFAEIVVVTSGRVYVLEHTGETLWGPVNIPGGGLGGPPTISDLDGDGEPEIGVAGSRNYVALETDGSIRWTSPTQDLSSNRTGSSVFDFEGDGRVEVLYGDELFFRIYDGISGEVLFEIENTSGTTLEYPIVADIDGDNSAEIVFTSSGSQTTGVRAFEASDDSWANTRRIWNQHTYHINNINEDGTIPLQEEPSWLSHNTYRLNTFPGRNVLALPDLTVSQLRVVDPSGGQPLSLSARIGNGGGARSLSGIAVRFYNGNPSAGGILLAEQTLSIIEPGEFTDITINNITGISAGGLIFVVVDPDNEMDECLEDNNQMSIVALGLLGDIGLSLNGTVFGSNTDIDLATQIINTGSLEGNYTVALSILDVARIEVASVAAFDVTALPPTESISFSNLWNTGTATSGNYIAQATLLDVDGNVLDTAEAGFTISDLTNPDGTPNGNPAAALRATTDRPFYHVDDQVQLDALAENITAIHPITNPELLMVVTDASGTELFNETVALSSLAPGQIAQAMRALNLAQAAEGVYQYRVTLLGDDELGNGGTSFATATASFEVLNDLNAAIRGTVAVQAPEVSQGDSQACTFTTLNTGTQDLSALAVNYRVLNVDVQTTITNDSASLDLAAGGSTNQLQSFSTSGVAPGNYACVLEATLDGESRTLAYGQFTVIETPINIVADLQVSTLPRLLVLVDPLQETCTANRSVTLEGEFSQVISDGTEVYAKVFGKHKYHGPKDYELAMPADFAGDTPVDEVNHNDGHPDIAITALTNERIQITLSDKDALAGQYRLLHYVSDYGWHPQLESGLIDFNCGSPLEVGQTVGELTVVDTDTVELLAANDAKHSPYGHAYGHKHRYDRDRKQAENPALETQYSVLETLLADRAYTLVDNTDDFEAELLSGQYQQYLLLSERQSLDHFTAKLLREAVNRGEGLVLASGRAPKAEPLWEALSIALLKRHHKGKGWGDDDDDKYYRHSPHKYRQLQADGVRFIESPIATAEDVLFGLERALPFIALDQATLAGSFLNPEVIKGKSYHHGKGWRYREDDNNKDDDKDDNYRGHHNHHSPLPQDVPAVTIADYGQGKAVFIGYDVLAEITHLGLDASVNQYVDLLLNSLNYTAPITLPQRLGSVVPVQLTLENLGSETPVTATLLWPLGSQLLDSVPAAATENELATWVFDLATDQTVALTSWAIPEYSSLTGTDANALVVAEVFIGDDTTQDPYQRLELTVQASEVESIDLIKQDLVALIDTETNRHHKKQLKKAQHWLKKAAHFYDKGKFEKALTKLLYATNHLKAVDTLDVVALRLRVDELLWKWGQQTNAGRIQ